MAFGSAGEIESALDAASDWGWSIDAAAVAEAKRRCDTVLSLLWGLTQ